VSIWKKKRKQYDKARSGREGIEKDGQTSAFIKEKIGPDKLPLKKKRRLEI